MERLFELVEELAKDDFDVKEKEIVKTNGLKKNAFIMTPKGGNVGVTIYTDVYKRQIESGEITRLDCAKDIIKTAEKNAIESIDTSRITNFEEVKNDICYKLVNEKLNRSDSYVSKSFYDLKYVFYVEMDMGFDGFPSFTVTNSIAEQWGVTVDELMEYAKENTKRKYGQRVESLAETVWEIMKNEYIAIFGGNEDMAKEMFMTSFTGFKGTVASNNVRTFGAVVGFDKDVLRKLAAESGTDLIIIPSSIHETIIIDYSSGDKLTELIELIRTINQDNLLPNEVLSNSAYIYSRSSDTIIQIGDEEQ